MANMCLQGSNIPALKLQLQSVGSHRNCPSVLLITKQDSLSCFEGTFTFLLNSICLITILPASLVKKSRKFCSSLPVKYEVTSLFYNWYMALKSRSLSRDDIMVKNECPNSTNMLFFVITDFSFAFIDSIRLFVVF
jgi:hypothetical protein